MSREIFILIVFLEIVFAIVGRYAIKRYWESERARQKARQDAYGDDPMFYVLMDRMKKERETKPTKEEKGA